MGGSVYPRAATPEDIGRIVEIDQQKFSSVYQGYNVDPGAHQEELVEKFTGRLNMVGGKWIKVLQQGDDITGVIMGCPTNKRPEDFISWEDTTDNGTLVNTYDPKGENVYVVSIAVLSEGTAVNGHNLLITSLIGEFVKDQHKLAYFESRLSGLRRWVNEQCEASGLDVASLSSDQLDDLARTYVALKREKNGKVVPYDRFVEISEGVGCKAVKVVADAYQDEPSMNYGVVFTYDNPLPKWSQQSPVISRAAACAIGFVSRHPRVLQKIME